MAVVLITGCSSGFGRLAAQVFAKRGDRVWATMRNPADGADLDGVGDATVHALDVCDDASVHACVDAVLARDGRVDVLVNNAGVGYIGAVEAFEWDLGRATMETNFWGALRMMRAVLPTMRAQGRGTIINVTSVAGLVPSPYNAYYSASKTALDTLTEAMAIEVEPFGIRMALVEPGFYATAIIDKSKAVKADVEDGPYAEAERKVIDFYTNGVAAGGDPMFVAERIVELADHDDPPLRTVCGDDAQMFVDGYKSMTSSEFAQILNALAGL
jgi:NAD(P)-dependent dehydrogenase (short-subunit alcohol dehydrogenase family)